MTTGRPTKAPRAKREKTTPFRASAREVALWQKAWKRVRMLEPGLTYSEWIRRALTYSAQMALR